GVSLPWSRWTVREFAGLLDDSRPAVRDRAIEELAHRGDSAIAGLKEVLEKSPSPQTRRNAVWALTRIETADARSVLRLALKDADASGRQPAVPSLGLQRATTSAEILVNLLYDPATPVKRNAATALGRLHRREAVPALFQVIDKGGDRFLEHAQIHALIVIAD